MREPTCCPSPSLAADPRWRPIGGPMPERVMRCGGCGALWTEELVSRMGFGGDEDREWEEYGRLSEADADRRFARVTGPGSESCT